jgi:hypothetical protein
MKYTDHPIYLRLNLDIVFFQNTTHVSLSTWCSPKHSHLTTSAADGSTGSFLSEASLLDVRLTPCTGKPNSLELLHAG